MMLWPLCCFTSNSTVYVYSVIVSERSVGPSNSLSGNHWEKEEDIFDKGAGTLFGNGLNKD